MAMKTFFIRLFWVLVFNGFLLLQVQQAVCQIPLIDKLAPSLNNDSTGTTAEITITNINKEIEYTDNLIIKKENIDFISTKEHELLQLIDTFNVFINNQGKDFRSFRSDKLSHYFLVNARTNWNQYNRRLRVYQANVQKLIRGEQEDQSQYIENRDRWERNIPDLQRKLSPQIVFHIDDNLKKIKLIIDQYDVRIKDLITTENSVIRDVNYIDGILSEINSLIEKRKTERFKQNEKNIFQTKFRDSFKGSISERLELAFYENTKSFGFFFETIKDNIIWYILFFVIIIAYFLYIRKKYKMLAPDRNTDLDKKINRIIVDRPGFSIAIIIMIQWNIISPYSPLFFNLFVYLTAAILLYKLTKPIVEAFFEKIIVASFVLLILSIIEIFAWYFGNYARFFLALESAIGIGLTFGYIAPLINLRKVLSLSTKTIIYTRIIALTIFAFYGIALISNIAGYLNLTNYCLRVGNIIAVSSILLQGFYQIGLMLINASVDVLNKYYPNIVVRYSNLILSRAKGFLSIMVLLWWLSGILRVSELYDSVMAVITLVFTDKINIGSISFSIGRLLSFITVLYVTYLIATFIKAILEREIMSKRLMKRGLAASISLTARISVVFFGTLIALSLSGLDLGKIGIIAGALSVGIGFGLQNVVNNFISGLILIYEKPVMEGDTVEVDTLLGRVSNIGIRSSTLITYDGAEVVVPNSNLISNQLINWTLSDNRKRIEIKVGTAYGSNPEQVLDLLLKAALSHEKVLTDPAPRPLFVDFGDSSLNFRLLFWVHFEDGIQTQSDVSIIVYNLFKENNIEIPFPQIDLHVKNQLPKKELENDNIE